MAQRCSNLEHKLRREVVTDSLRPEISEPILTTADLDDFADRWRFELLKRPCHGGWCTLCIPTKFQSRKPSIPSVVHQDQNFLFCRQICSLDHYGTAESTHGRNVEIQQFSDRSSYSLSVSAPEYSQCFIHQPTDIFDYWSCPYLTGQWAIEFVP